MMYYQLCVFFFCVSVDADEIKRLGKRFRKLDLDNSGALSIDEFMSLPELQQNPLVQRVIDIFDADGNGEVDFKGNDDIQLTSKIALWWVIKIILSGIFLKNIKRNYKRYIITFDFSDSFDFHIKTMSYTLLEVCYDFFVAKSMIF